MRPRLRLALVAVIGLAVVGGGSWAAWALRHPHGFRDVGGVGEYLAAAKVGTTAYFDVYDFGTSTPRVTLRSAVPTVQVNTADATFELLLCTPKAADGSSGIGLVSGRSGERYCAFAPISGAVVDPAAESRPQLILAITPHRSGRVLVRGLDLHYDSGWQTGTQHLRIDAGLSASPR